MDVFIVATTERGTRAALHAAQAFSAGFDTHITVIVRRVVPYRQPLDVPVQRDSIPIERLRLWADEFRLSLSVNVCVCRPDDRVLAQVFPANSVVLIGGVRGGLFRNARETRLASTLEQAGRSVLLVDYDGSVTNR